MKNRYLFFILLFFGIFLLFSYIFQFSSAKPVSNTNTLTKHLEPECFSPRYLGSNMFPFSVHGKNLVYYSMSNNPIPMPLDIQRFYVLNLGRDQKPFTFDDGLNLQINGAHISYQLSEEGGNLMPKINDKYLVWMDLDNNMNSIIKAISLGSNGILEQLEINSARTVFSGSSQAITSFNLNDNVLTLVYEDSARYQGSQNIFYCDLSLPLSVNGSCGSSREHSTLLQTATGIRISEAYGYKQNGNYIILWNQYISRFTGLFFSAYYLDVSTRTITQLGLNDNLIKSVIGSFISSNYNGRVYFYFEPSSTPLSVSSGPSDQGGIGSPSTEGSSGGNYLISYYKESKGKWYLGTFNGIEAETPFNNYLNIPVFDSSSRGNFVYHTDNQNRLYFTQCYGL